MALRINLSLYTYITILYIMRQYVIIIIALLFIIELVIQRRMYIYSFF